MSGAETTTKITIKSNRATGMSAVHKSSNINGMAFNLDYIAEKDSDLALKLMDMYARAKGLEKLNTTTLTN